MPVTVRRLGAAVVAIANDSRTPPILLAVLFAVGAFPVVRSLIVRELRWCYPFFTSDSYDWIRNGLYWAGEPVRNSWRPPALPAVIAALWDLGALNWLPAVNFIALGASAMLLYALVRERHGPWLSALAGWVLITNGFVQDFTRYIMAEIYCTPFLILAALSFHRAARDDRWYLLFGVSIGLGFLAHYATLPAAIGFALAILIFRSQALRSLRLYQGAAIALMITGAWVGFRYWEHALNPTGPRHIIESLVTFSLSNWTFYVLPATALLGLVPLPLYALGFFSLSLSLSLSREATSGDREFALSVLAPLLSVSIFWLFLYDWADKRFLLYGFPLTVCLFAEGVDRLWRRARLSPSTAAVAVCYVGAAIVWNQIQYSTHGLGHLAIAPQYFVDTRPIVDDSNRTSFRYSEATVFKLHESLGAAFAGGMFDYRLKPRRCVGSKERGCFADLKRKLDSELSPSEPIGIGTLPGWPLDDYARTGRAGIILLRHVSPAGHVPLNLTRRAEATNSFWRCGPFALSWGR